MGEGGCTHTVEDPLKQCFVACCAALCTFPPRLLRTGEMLLELSDVRVDVGLGVHRLQVSFCFRKLSEDVRLCGLYVRVGALPCCTRGIRRLPRRQPARDAC